MVAWQKDPRPWQAFMAGIFSLIFLPPDQLSPSLAERNGARLGSLTVAVEEREHHVAHVVGEFHLGHRPGHLLHRHCNGRRAQS